MDGDEYNNDDELCDAAEAKFRSHWLREPHVPVFDALIGQHQGTRLREKEGRNGRMKRFLNADCVVATWGKLIHYIETGQFNIRRLEMVVFDEFDNHMEDDKGRGVVRNIIRSTAHNANRQMVYISATFVPDVVLQSTLEHQLKLHDCLRIPKACLFEVGLDRKKESTIKEIAAVDHYLVICDNYKSKCEKLWCLVQNELDMFRESEHKDTKLPKIMVFCKTRRNVQQLYDWANGALEDVITTDGYITRSNARRDLTYQKDDPRYDNNVFGWPICNSFQKKECEKEGKCKFWHGTNDNGVIHIPFIWGCSDSDTLREGRDQSSICHTYVFDYATNKLVRETGRCHKRACNYHHPVPVDKEMDDTDTDAKTETGDESVAVERDMELKEFEDTEYFKSKFKGRSWLEQCWKDHIYRQMSVPLLDDPTKIDPNEITQEERNQNMRRLATEGGIMICTDVLQRGVSITNVNLVIQWDMANDENNDDYIHRSGRTGRKGDDMIGRVVSFYSFAEDPDSLQAYNFISSMVYLQKYSTIKFFWNQPDWRKWIIDHVFYPELEKNEALEKFPEVQRWAATEEAYEEAMNLAGDEPTEEQIENCMPEEVRSLPKFKDEVNEQEFTEILHRVFNITTIGTRMRSNLVETEIIREIDDGAAAETGVQRYQRMKQSELEELERRLGNAKNTETMNAMFDDPEHQEVESHEINSPHNQVDASELNNTSNDNSQWNQPANSFNAAPAAVNDNQWNQPANSFNAATAAPAAVNKMQWNQPANSFNAAPVAHNKMQWNQPANSFNAAPADTAATAAPAAVNKMQWNQPANSFNAAPAASAATADPVAHNKMQWNQPANSSNAAPAATAAETTTDEFIPNTEVEVWSSESDKDEW